MRWHGYCSWSTVRKLKRSSSFSPLALTTTVCWDLSQMSIFWNVIRSLQSCRGHYIVHSGFVWSTNNTSTFLSLCKHTAQLYLELLRTWDQVILWLTWTNMWCAIILLLRSTGKNIGDCVWKLACRSDRQLLEFRTSVIHRIRSVASDDSVTIETNASFWIDCWIDSQSKIYSLILSSKSEIFAAI